MSPDAAQPPPDAVPLQTVNQIAPIPVDLMREAPISAGAAPHDVTIQPAANSMGEHFQEIVPIQTVQSPGIKTKTPKANSKPTFRIDPSLISGVRSTPNVTCNVPDEGVGNGSPETSHSCSVKGQSVSASNGQSQQTPGHSDQVSSQANYARENIQNTPKPEDSQVIIRRDSANSIGYSDRKPMLSFESPMPSVEMLRNRIVVAESLDGHNNPSEVRPKKANAQTKRSSHPPEIGPRVSSSVPREEQNTLPPSMPPPKCTVKVELPQQPIKLPEQKKKPSYQIDDQQINVSNVIKRFNDKCESLASSKQDLSKSAKVFHSVQSNKGYNARPVYATMDCRSKRNNLMTRGYTVTEYSIRAESFRRQASMTGASEADCGSRPHVKGQPEHISHPNHPNHHHVYQTHQSHAGSQNKIRSKSQSSADEDTSRRAAYDYAQGNVPTYRVRFDESSLRGCDQRKPQSQPSNHSQRRTRPASAGNSDQEGDGDDDMYEKYETLV